jgi:hypothetical protein
MTAVLPHERHIDLSVTTPISVPQISVCFAAVPIVMHGEYVTALSPGDARLVC